MLDDASVEPDAIDGRYHLETDDPFVDEARNVLILPGTLTNLSDASWSTATGGLGDVKVGCRFCTDGQGEAVAFETRAQGLAPLIGRGEQSDFEFQVPLRLLPRNVAAIVIDVVKEGVCWFGDVGGTPLTVPVEVRAPVDTRRLLRRRLGDLARVASPTQAERIKVVSEALLRYDFSTDVSNFSTLVRAALAGKALPIVRPPSALAARATAGRVPNASDALFFRHYLVAEGAEEEDQSYIGWIEHLRSVVRSSAGRRGASIPMPKHFADWLAAPALPLELSPLPLSRSMLALRPHDAPMWPGRADTLRDECWRYATQVMIDCNVGSDLIPDIVRNELVAPESRDSLDDLEQFPALSAFLFRLHDEDEGYRGRYDLRRPAGRCAFAFDHLILGFDNESRRELIGSAPVAWMLESLEEDPEGLTPFEALLIGNIDIAAGMDVEPERLVSDLVRDMLPWMGKAQPTPAAPTVRLLGLVNSSTGLGANLSMSQRALERLQLPTELVDTATLTRRPGSAAGAEPGDIALRRNVDLIHLNPDLVPWIASRLTTRDRVDAHRIVFALWEASVAPREHLFGLQMVDEVWVPTNYLADVYRATGHPNIHMVGKAISLPAPLPFDRRSIGIDEGDTMFLTSFDIHSWIERKNPMAAVDAFREAFPQSQRNVKLVVKTTQLIQHPGDRTRQVSRVLAAAQEDDRIVVLRSHLPFREYLGLIASADATVSSHRAEGFGYLPAYSLLLDTPVITADYSGTTDFCTAQTSFPVAVEVRRIKPHEFVFVPEGAEWADVRISAMAEAMRQVVEDPAEARRRTDVGRAFVAQRYAPDAFAGRYRERLRAAGLI